MPRRRLFFTYGEHATVFQAKITFAKDCIEGTIPGSKFIFA
jgi:hypothetical protein